MTVHDIKEESKMKIVMGTTITMIFVEIAVTVAVVEEATVLEVSGIIIVIIPIEGPRKYIPLIVAEASNNNIEGKARDIIQILPKVINSKTPHSSIHICHNRQIPHPIYYHHLLLMILIGN